MRMVAAISMPFCCLSERISVGEATRARGVDLAATVGPVAARRPDEGLGVRSLSPRHYCEPALSPRRITAREKRLCGMRF